MEKLQPKLRFLEFNDIWEKSVIGNIATVSSGGTPNRSNANYWGGNIPWVSTTLIDFNRIKSTDELITEDGLKNSAAKIFPKGTLLMALYGQGKTRGKIAILDIDASTNQACGAIIPNQLKINNRFLFQNLAGRYNEIRDLSNQGGQENLSGSILKNIDIYFPTLPEQTKIANFLSSVDEKLNLLKEKRALLEEYKKGIIQKIFNQEIRFKDYNGEDFEDWEEKSIGNILTIGSGRDYKHLNYGNVPVFGTGGLMTYVDSFLHQGETVCIGRKGTIDKPMYYNGDIWTVDTLFYTHTFIESIPKFVYYVFQSINWKQHNEASGVPSLSKSTIEQILINVPSVAEQSKIANFLSAIDEKIALVSNQIQDTQEYKKGLLQQMFV